MAQHPSHARRIAPVLTPVIPWLNGLARRHAGTLSLAQGMVDWPPPPAVRQLQSLDPDLDRYGAMAGDDALLAAIHHDLVDRRGLDLVDAELLVTAGSNMAFYAVIQAICDPGDEVILPIPYYFNHVMAVQLAGGVPLTPSLGLVPDPEALAACIGPRTRAIVTVSPGNPSGVVLPPPVLTSINRLCADRGLFHLSDEAYADFVHGLTPHVSPGRVPGSGRHTVSLFSLSKAYGMAGWRVGYASVPRQLMAALAKVQDTVLICPPRITQRAALAALAAGPTWCAERAVCLAPRRRLLLEAIAREQAAGAPWRLLAEPDGAFYALLQMASAEDDGPLMERLIRDHGVAVVAGGSFGLPATGSQLTLRLSYGMLSEPLLQQALERLFRGLRQTDR
ncbi:MAG: aminotransferase class I/II-fold pyridoxal phosphate-dependent enzyme [Cyanobacteriota bacterium]|nr:aminotransferase class I/II-fold pyridoxal phosphate-dependent enzyme [Cyanobacteriota bacterium]